MASVPAVTIYVALALLVASGMLLVSWAVTRFLTGDTRRLPGKLDTYECGVPLLSSARCRFHVRFYVMALMFLLFGVEVVFLYPWAVNYGNLVGDPAFGWIVLGEVGVFAGVLALGLIYIWKRRLLEWR